MLKSQGFSIAGNLAVDGMCALAQYGFAANTYANLHVQGLKVATRHPSKAHIFVCLLIGLTQHRAMLSVLQLVVL